MLPLLTQKKRLLEYGGYNQLKILTRKVVDWNEQRFIKNWKKPEHGS